MRRRIPILGYAIQTAANPSLARQVILTLDLQHSPTFLGGQEQSSIFASLKRIFSREKTVDAPTSALPRNNRRNEMKDRQFTSEEAAALEPYEDAIAAGETVEPITGTSLVNIKYRHTDPQLAQRLPILCAKSSSRTMMNACNSGDIGMCFRLSARAPAISAVLAIISNSRHPWAEGSQVTRTSVKKETRCQLPFRP